MIRRSGDAVCGLHHAQREEEHEFLSLPSKPRSTVCQWFGLKTDNYDFFRFGLKTGVYDFSRFEAQNRQLRFGDLGLKLTTTVSWFGA
jgi:hypothetical protein